MRGFLRSRSWLIMTATITALAVITTSDWKPSQPEQYRKKKEEVKRFDKPDEFIKAFRDMRIRDGKTKSDYPQNYKLTEMRRFGIIPKDGEIGTSVQRIGKTGATLDWVERGPNNVPGRTRGMIVDPDDATGATWFAGSVGGGVWKTTNSGFSWTPLTEGIPNLATTSLAMAPSNHNIIYVGTGEGFGNLDGVGGDGIFKTTNKGASWTQLASTIAVNSSSSNRNFEFVNRISVHPTDPSTLVVATNTGIMRSTDGGDTWTKVHTSASAVQDLVANPQNWNTQYASKNASGIIKSLDGGITWTSYSTGITQAQRIEVAISPVDTNRLYLAVENASDLSDLYVTYNGGTQWYLVNVQTGTNPDWLNGQGWYDNTIVAHPTNPNVCYTAGVSVFKHSIVGDGPTVRVTLVDTVGTAGWLAFQNFGLSYLGGGVSTGENGFGSTNPVGLTSQDSNMSIEVRFGPGRSQKAHRFKTDAQGAGQTSPNYKYQNYVNVPFEAWDVTNNRQINISFRDENNDGEFDIELSSGDGVYREYFFVEGSTYNSGTPDPNITVDGGFKYRVVLEVGPALPTDVDWNPATIPDSKISLTRITNQTKLRTSEVRSDPYGQFSGPNSNVHPDHHNLMIIPVAGAPFKILNANDGGVWISLDSAGSFALASGGYNTTQFYGVDKAKGSNTYIAGAQDNGTWLSSANPTSTSGWASKIGGDGFEALWNYGNSNLLLGASQFNGVQRSSNAGASFSNSISGLATGSGNAPFVSNLSNSPLDPDLVFAVGAQGVYRSTNFGSSWTLVSIPSQWGMWSMSGTEISLANSNIVWAHGGMSNTGTRRKVHVSKDRGATFAPVNNYLTNSNDTTSTIGLISGFATHPREDSTAYALFSVADAPKILRTTNLGSTWEDISGFGDDNNSSNGFPDVAVYTLIVMPHNTNEIWAGTEIGLFISTNNGATWSYANNGLPAVAIWQMSIKDKQVIVATHGRGVWTVDISGIPAIPTSSGTIATMRLGKNFSKVFAAKLSSYFTNPDGTGFTYSVKTSNGGVVPVISSDSLYLTSTTDYVGSVTVSAYAYNGYKLNKSFTVNVENDVVAPVLSVGALTTPAIDAVKFGVTADEPIKNVLLAVNSQSVSLSKQGNIYFGTYTIASSRTLTVAVSAKDTSDNLSSKNVTYNVAALSKPLVIDKYTITGKGNEGYILATTTAAENIPTGWTEIAPAIRMMATAPGADLKVEANVQGLQDVVADPQFDESRIGIYEFAEGQWRHIAEANNGRVMAKHTGNPVAIYYNPDYNVVPNKYELEQNYPNPFNPSTMIRYSVKNEGRVVIKVYNMLGQEVRTLVNEHKPAGRFNVSWDGRNNAGQTVSTGVYIYRMQAGSVIQNRKMLFVK
ncbi:T9SS type A sorting domain-containing protein [bacterium]|nr:T9SS type A sorting domain-containing protein [bacterium]NUN44697.1 T9SS type A sorting domain-containing protein [bacterium]